MSEQEKAPYETPELTVRGSVEAVTSAHSFRPTRLDKDFPSQTPFEDTTWS